MTKNICLIGMIRCNSFEVLLSCFNNFNFNIDFTNKYTGMKSLTVIAIAAILFYGFTRIQTRTNHVVVDEVARERALNRKQLFTLSCSPDLNFFNPDDSTNTIPLLEVGVITACRLPQTMIAQEYILNRGSICITAFI
jgi:arginine exporter protein ArgO